MTRPIKRVAIIGAGPTGLAQLKNILDTRSLGNRAYELEAVVFESKPDVGGVWYSTDEPKKYKRAVVHNDWKGKGKEEEQMYLYPPPSDDPSPMYEGLRTNLPKELMAFRDFPFPDETPLFPDRKMIYQYFRDYATHFNLWSHIRFNTRVNRLYRRLVPDLDNTHEEEGDDRGKWVIESCGSTDFDGSDKMEEFDFVCVGNGHYQDGWIPPIPGLSTFRGKILHSIYYLRPSDYRSRSILVVGSFASGSDLARQLASLNIGEFGPGEEEKEGYTKVFVSCSNPPEGEDPWTPYIDYMPLISHLENGDIVFHPSSSESDTSSAPNGTDGSGTKGTRLKEGEVDTIIFATGYNFALPFCKTSDSPWNSRPLLQDSITSEEREGGRKWEIGGMKGLTMQGMDPLLLFPEGDRSIAFPILQYQIVPFPLAETQTRLLALLWSGCISLPSEHDISTQMPRNASNPYSSPSHIPDQDQDQNTRKASSVPTRKVVHLRRQLVFGSPYEFEYQEYLLSLMDGGDDNAWVERWWAAQGVKKGWRADTTLRKRTLGY